MILVNHAKLKFLNGRCDLTFNHIAYEKLRFHKICTFPQNIFFIVEDDGATNKNYIKLIKDGQYITIQKDHFYFIPAGKTVEYAFLDDTVIMTFHFNLEIYPGMDLYHHENNPVFSGHDPEMTSFFRSIFDDTDPIRTVIRYKEAIMKFCLAHWPEETGGPSDRYHRLFQFIRDNCDARLTVADLADLYDLTQEAFSRKIRRDLNITPKKLIRKELLKRICSMLGTPGKSITMIANELHFSSPFYLSRFFKEQTGLTPAGYLRQFSHNVS